MGWGPSDKITRIYILREVKITWKENSDLFSRISKFSVEHSDAILLCYDQDKKKKICFKRVQNLLISLATYITAL